MYFLLFILVMTNESNASVCWLNRVKMKIDSNSIEAST